MTDENERYSRQILFDRIGAEGQRRIREATVGLVGLGALGTAVADIMVRAGVGRLVCADRDFVEESNLNRQGLFTEHHARERRPKAVAAAEALTAVNPTVRIDAQVADINATTIGEVFGDVDLILDGTDSFETRYLINDFAILENIPWIYGACVAARGMTATILPGETPCLACHFPEPPAPGQGATCDTAGIIAPAARLTAAIQTTEALKILVDDRQALRKSLLSIELWPFRMVEIGRADAGPRPDCPACVGREGRFLDREQGGDAVTLCGRDAVQILPGNRGEVDLDGIARRLEDIAEVRLRNDYLLVAAVGEREMTLFRDGRALIKGTTDAAAARSLYARFVGI